MSKQKKGNKETKKPKAEPSGTKKEKKDPKRHDGTINGLFGNSKQFDVIEFNSAF